MLKGAVMTHKHYNIVKGFGGTCVEVPTLPTAMDLGFESLRQAVAVYHAAYDGVATTVLYSLNDAEFVRRMRTEPHLLEGIQFWVELHSTLDAWGVLGREGLVWVEGA